MNPDLKLSATNLKRGELRRIEDGKGALLQCLGGTLWLTQDGDARDLILEAGDELRIERNGLSIVSALSDCSFVLQREAVALRLPRQVLPWRHRPATAAGPSARPAWARP